MLSGYCVTNHWVRYDPAFSGLRTWLSFNFCAVPKRLGVPIFLPLYFLTFKSPAGTSRRGLSCAKNFFRKM